MDLLESLTKIRSLLSVKLGREEESLIIKGLKLVKKLINYDINIHIDPFDI